MTGDELWDRIRVLYAYVGIILTAVLGWGLMISSVVFTVLYFLHGDQRYGISALVLLAWLAVLVLGKGRINARLVQ